MPKRIGDDSAAGHCELVLSDLHHRITGVSASIRSVLPALNQQYHLMFLARRNQGSVAANTLWSGLREMARPIARRPFRIWHVRRNNEMFWGLIARDVLRLPVKLVFTSAAIRRHSWYPRQLIVRMDAVIATSDRAAACLENARVAAIVPHGVDIERFELDDRQDGPVLEGPWSAFTTCLGIVGRVRPEKGTDLFVDALCKTLPANPDACAIIAGKITPSYRTFALALKDRLEQAGLSERVFFLDEVAAEDMPLVYKRLDIVCAPARYEGFGLVPIEAMVSGTAVIASRTGAYEAMVEDGRTGFLVEVESADQLAEAINKLVAHPSILNRMKLAGYDKVRQEFSLLSEVAGLSAVYEGLWSNPEKD